MTPTFLCIGGQRCGTTWLHSVLDALPHVQVCKDKETDFFYTRSRRTDLAGFERNFDPPPGEPPFAVRGELSPNYCMLKRPTIELIHRLYPWLRLLLIVRNPAERTLSQTWLDLRHMHGQASKEPLSLGEYLRHLERQRTQRRNDFARVIADWQAVFGREALHIELYDDLCQDPDGFLRRVLRHIGADDTVPLPTVALGRRVFESVKSPVPPVVRWYVAKEFRASVCRLNDLLGGRCTHWLEAMDQTLAETQPSWWLLRGLNKYVLSVPEKVAYASYDAWRDWCLAGRRREILAHHTAASPPAPPTKPPKTGFHQKTVSV